MREVAEHQCREITALSEENAALSPARGAANHRSGTDILLCRISGPVRPWGTPAAVPPPRSTSGLVFADGVLYGVVFNGSTFDLEARRATTGERIWSFGGPMDEQEWSSIAGGTSPVVSGGVVDVLGSHQSADERGIRGRLFALDARDGTLLGQCSLAENANSPQHTRRHGRDGVRSDRNR
jgi:outer membrane protein assembly factor BamB